MHANRTSNRCPVSETELLAYRDRELAPARQRQMAGHLEQCPVCQARLADAKHLVSTLTLGTPARDNPVARAALHDRIAAGPTAWWRHRALIATALPVTLLVFVLVSFSRFQGADCESCPPLTPPLQITAISGLPAGWGSPPTCQRATTASQRRGQVNQAGNPNANLNAANRPAADVSTGGRQARSAPAAKQLAVFAHPDANRPQASNVTGTIPTSGNRSSPPVASACSPGQQAGATYLPNTGLVRADQPGT